MTEKLIPFDIEIALREPERVRFIGDSGLRVKRIAHFPGAEIPIFIQWEDYIKWPLGYTYADFLLAAIEVDDE